MANFADIESRVSDSTGVAKKIVSFVLKAFFKHLLYLLDDDENHSVTIAGFGTIVLKKIKQPGQPIGGNMPTQNPNARALKIITSRTLSDKTKELGYRKAVKEIWGEEFEYVRGRQIKRD